ncbi:sulfotransferase family 2 domain-containing protein [Pseudoalteromonas rubra]|uniref:sulfotransferase family 2 domain-containing protein n=1 Tax=Pseudoalteromonas rubra TaxID=43658 RepID=UPI0013DE1863|nr:sulfotransferase family 2 domain-containing protein [Pseudoalteromonas rubra]
MRAKGAASTRADTQAHLSKINSARDYALISSHLNYGLHKELGADDFRLVTFLRDPYKRVLSAYTYNCMRAQQRVSLAGFEAFFKQEENQNVASKQLSPGDYAPGCSSEIFQLLEQNFHVYGTNEHIDKSISYFLTTLDLSNVLTERINQTLPQYRLDASKYQAEVMELNQDDQTLFELVRANPRVPECGGSGVQEMSMSSVIMHETEKELASKTRLVQVGTPVLVNALHQAQQHGQQLTFNQLLGTP